MTRLYRCDGCNATTEEEYGWSHRYVAIIPLINIQLPFKLTKRFDLCYVCHTRLLESLGKMKP